MQFVKKRERATKTRERNLRGRREVRSVIWERENKK